MGKRDATPELEEEEPPILGWGTPLSKLVEDTKQSARLVHPPCPLLQPCQAQTLEKIGGGIVLLPEVRSRNDVTRKEPLSVAVRPCWVPAFHGLV
jgi:hypothetical protein